MKRLDISYFPIQTVKCITLNTVSSEIYSHHRKFKKDQERMYRQTL